MASLNSWVLTTVADVKESLSIDSGDSSKNNLITRKINQATDIIEGWCGLNNSQHFALTTYTNEEYDSAGANQLVLKRRPVVDITSFQSRNTSQNLSDWTSIDSELYFIDYPSGVIDLLFTLGNNWNRQRVTYSAGFATIPSDLAEACVILASFLVDNATSTGTSVKAKREGGRSIEYHDTSKSGTGSDSLIEQLGLDDMLSRYVDTPILADK